MNRHPCPGFNRLVIFGDRDCAELAKFYFDLEYPGLVVAHTVDQKYMSSENFKGVPVVPFEEVQQRYSPKDTALFIPMTQTAMGRHRAAKYTQAKEMGYKLANYIAPSATCFEGSILGDNNFIFEDNTIQPFVKIGSNNVFWSGNHIGHHSTIQNHVFITSHVVVSGHVVIEDFCYLGVNATIRNAIRLKEGTLVGMGAIIGKDTPEPNQVYTSPNTKPREGQTSTDLM